MVWPAILHFLIHLSGQWELGLAFGIAGAIMHAFSKPKRKGG